MKENKLEEQHKRTFDELKHINKAGQEFWYARDLQQALDYSRWEKFNNVVEKAKTACVNSGQAIDNHFHHMVKMVPDRIGKGALS
jgi:DNA-damage-inducible protein D